MWRLMDSAEADVVYGLRRQRTGETVLKRGTAALFYRLMRHIGDADLPVDAGDFRPMTRRVLDILNSMPEQYRFIRGMVSWIGLRQVPLAYDRAPRHSGESNYPLAKMVGLAFDALTSFSIMPLRLASYLGLALGFLSLLMLGYTLGSWAIGHVVKGWSSLLTMVADPRLNPTHSVRAARRICRPALSRKQKVAVVRHRSGATQSTSVAESARAPRVPVTVPGEDRNSR
jgi:polyisoprenyl-phosphate glycosyltransferase